jgi:hypothetical protein
MTGDAIDLWVLERFEFDLVADQVVLEFTDFLVLAAAACGCEAKDN